MPAGPQTPFAYPQDLESVGIALDGTPVTLRPVRPADEPLLQDLFAHMSRQDVRRRFLASIRELSHPFAARLSRPDYDREMALLAQHDDMTLGVARYSADPDKQSAEFAVAVRSDWKGHGVGYLLMSRLIEVARAAAIGELVGYVLRENQPMLDMCRDFGFTRAANPKDATLMTVRKSLRSGD
jgi:acetyltransferase